MIISALLFALATSLALLLLAGLLHLMPKLGPAGKSLSQQCQHAPGLDIVVTLFTVTPEIVGGIYLGWWGIAAGLVAQIVALEIWMFLHEWANPTAAAGPRVVKTLNKNIGWIRNHVAVWTTALAVPLFWLVRVSEWIVYPPLIWLVRFPRYQQSEWVNVSRQKFAGLVGWDLIWCLYCDWMTGVWSLGTEMLRNVESFWCPIRFYSDKKCENCKIDFPDIEGGWVDADGDMRDVAEKLTQMYGPDNAGPNAWFGHATRLTVQGQPLEDAQSKSDKKVD